ncbi:MAG: hypothetical protein ACR5LA_06905 [Wolbachia sp.]
MNKNSQRVTLESRNSVSYSDDKKRSTDASEQILEKSIEALFFD